MPDKTSLFLSHLPKILLQISFEESFCLNLIKEDNEVMKAKHILKSVGRGTAILATVSLVIIAVAHYIPNDKGDKNAAGWFLAAVFILIAIGVTVSIAKWLQVYRQFSYLKSEYNFDIDTAVVDYYVPEWGPGLRPNRQTMNNVVMLLFTEENGVLKFIEKLYATHNIINQFELPVSAIKKVVQMPSRTNSRAVSLEQILYINGLSEKLSDTSKSQKHLLWSSSVTREDFNMLHVSALISIGRNTSASECQRIIIKGLVSRYNLPITKRTSGIRMMTQRDKSGEYRKPDFWSDLLDN